MAQSATAVFRSKEMIGYVVAAVIGLLFASGETAGFNAGASVFLHIIMAYGFAAIWCGFLFMRRQARRRRAAGQIEINVHVHRTVEEHNKFMLIKAVSNFMAAMVLGFFILPVRVTKLVSGTAAA